MRVGTLCKSKAQACVVVRTAVALVSDGARSVGMGLTGVARVAGVTARGNGAMGVRYRHAIVRLPWAHGCL